MRCNPARRQRLPQGRAAACLCWKLVPVGAGGRGLRVPSHRPWQPCGGRHGRRGGPARPAEVGREWAGAVRSKCARSSPISGCLHCAAYGGGAPANGGSPAARRGNLFPRDRPVQAISLLRPRPMQGAASRAGSRPGGQPAAQGPSSRFCLAAAQQQKNPLTSGRGANGRWGPGRDRVPLPGCCVRLAAQQPGQPLAFTRGSNITPRSAF